MMMVLFIIHKAYRLFQLVAGFLFPEKTRGTQPISFHFIWIDGLSFNRSSEVSISASY